MCDNVVWLGWDTNSKRPMIDDRQLIERLADGRFHSGEALAQLTGVSRTAVWKHLQSIGTRYDLRIHAVRGKGYRIACPIELLSLEAIEKEISHSRRQLVENIQILESVSSTSRHLSEKIDTFDGQSTVCFAEHQSAGRGRRGRSWVSPYGANVYLSLYWQFDLPMASLNGLSLVAGVAAAQAVARMGIPGVALKWPNDIHIEERKLGGILVEVFGQTAGPVSAIIGIGINVDMPADYGRDIDQEWIDIRRALSGRQPERNRLAGLLIDELIGALVLFTEKGWIAFESSWQERDLYRGREVEIHTSKGVERGTYTGVNSSGGLMLKQRGSVRVFHAGDVSLRSVGEGIDRL